MDSEDETPTDRPAVNGDLAIDLRQTREAVAMASARLNRASNLLMDTNSDIRELRKIVERAVEAMQRAARATEDIASREHLQLISIANRMANIETSLAVNTDNIKDAQRAAESAREATGRVALMKPDDKSGKHGNMIESFGRQRVVTQILIIIGIALAIASGWVSKALG